jgi:hypothetical protein
MAVERQMTFADESPEYKAFVEKFRPKKTTDDCYTPENVYSVVRDWAVARYAIPPDTEIVRPFWPGGDYERFDYPDGCVVIDNPPFSVLSKIVRFYDANGVRFFLFAPALTMFNYARNKRIGFVAASCSITYGNGAVVRTGFVTNMWEYVVETAPDLCRAVKAADDANVKAAKKSLPKYVYPPDVLTSSRAAWLSEHGAAFRVRRGDAALILKLDAHGDKSFFGGGLLLSERAAAERVEAERAAAERAAAERAAAERAAAERAAAERAAAVVFELSPREREMQRLLGGRGRA